jgi:transposase
LRYPQAIELWRTRCHYQQDTVFNACTYLAFLEQLARRYRCQGVILIQDNASYHKDAEVWAWFKSNCHWLEVHQLPPYSPGFNPAERLWQYTRRTGTHNRYLASEAELVRTMTRVFGELQSNPELIRSRLLPFLLIFISLHLCATAYNSGAFYSHLADLRKTSQ